MNTIMPGAATLSRMSRNPDEQTAPKLPEPVGTAEPDQGFESVALRRQSDAEPSQGDLASADAC